ncbi:MAG: ATP-binding cassette domain-containing protein [Geminicoccaceae bacterium]
MIAGQAATSGVAAPAPDPVGPASRSRPAAPPIINLTNVRKVYRKKRSEFLAVSDVTLAVQPGEIISLVGPSGCGKTTVLKILAGLHSHDGGTVEIGNAAMPVDPSRDIGMVFQQSLLLKWRRILENVLLPAEILGLPRRESRERALGLIEMVGLAGIRERLPVQTLRRHAATRLHRPGTGARSESC